MLLSTVSKGLLRPGTVIAVAMVMLLSLYLFSQFHQCCNGDPQLLGSSLWGIDSDSKLIEPTVSDACYHSNLLNRLAEVTADQAEVRSQLPIKPGFYATLETPVDLANLTSESCANAVAPITVNRMLNDSNCFRHFANSRDMAEVYRQLGHLFSNFTSRGLELFLLDGSLIGSVRHFGLVPWDDDFDFGIRVDQKSQVRGLLEELSKSSTYLFLDTEALNMHWKLGIRCDLVNGTKSCLLAVDLFLIRNSGRWFIRPEQPRVFSIKDVYPLSWRPFGPGLLLPSPRRPLRFLRRQYKSDVMRQCHYQPHTSTGCSKPTMTCQAIRALGRHPFVEFVRLPAPSTGWPGEKNITVELLLWKRYLLSVFLPYDD